MEAKHPSRPNEYLVLERRHNNVRVRSSGQVRGDSYAFEMIPGAAGETSKSVKVKREKSRKKCYVEPNLDRGAEENIFGEYAKMYVKNVKGVSIIGHNNQWICKGFPSIHDVVMGLYKRYCVMIEQAMRDKPE